MKLIQAGLVALALPVFLGAAAAPVKPAPKPAAKAIASKPSAPIVKTSVKSTAVKTATKPDAKSAPADFSTPRDYPQSVSFPGGVTMTGMVYSSMTGFRPLTLDLYQPTEKSEKSAPRPVLVFIHGGNWVGGDSRHDSPYGDFPSVLASIAARGFVVASVNYRLASEAHFPAPLQDIKTAIRFLRSHASDYNLDDTRFAAWGVSAGGHLAAMTGVSCGVAALEPGTPAGQTPPSDCVQAVIDWCGLINLETIYTDFDKPIPDTSVEGALLGCEPALCPTEVAKNASPLTYITAQTPPFLIQHGDADTIVSVKQSQALADALKAQGVPVDLVIYPGITHMLARPNPNGPSTFDPQTDMQALAKVESFLDATFPQKAALATPSSATSKAKTK